MSILQNQLEPVISNTELCHHYGGGSPTNTWSVGQDVLGVMCRNCDAIVPGSKIFSITCKERENQVGSSFQTRRLTSHARGASGPRMNLNRQVYWTDKLWITAYYLCEIFQIWETRQIQIWNCETMGLRHVSTYQFRSVKLASIQKRETRQIQNWSCKSMGIWHASIHQYIKKYSLPPVCSMTAHSFLLDVRRISFQSMHAAS